MASVSYSQLVRQNRNFRHWWGGQIVSQLGDWFSAITLQSLLLYYTNSTTSLLGMMVATMAPHFLIGPFAGVVVDRLPRKAIMIGADLLRAAIALGLLAVRGPETVWVAYVCIAAISSITAFFEPARIATLPSITDEDELVTANALSAVTWSILLTSGAVIGGLVGRFFGPSTAFVLNSLSFVLSAWILTGLRVPATEGQATGGRGFGDLLAGFQYVRAHPEISWAITAKLGWALAGGMQVLIPVYGQRVFPLPGDRTGQLAISLLFAAGGLGTALGPVFARRFTGRDPGKIRWAIASGFLLGGVFYTCMAAAPNLAGVSLFLLLARMHGAVVWVFSTVLLQILTADQFRGRVFAVETSLFTLGMMLSSLLTSFALDLRWATVPQVTVALGLSSLLVSVIWLTRVFRARGAEAQPPTVPAQAPISAGSAASTDGEA